MEQKINKDSQNHKPFFFLSKHNDGPIFSYLQHATINIIPNMFHICMNILLNLGTRITQILPAVSVFWQQRSLLPYRTDISQPQTFTLKWIWGFSTLRLSDQVSIFQSYCDSDYNKCKC